MVYYWVSEYDDGFILDQREGARYIDIDRERLKSFTLYSDESAIVSLQLDASKSLVYRLRTAINAAGADVVNRVHIVGYRTSDGNDCFFFAHEGGVVDQRSGFVEGHKWYYPVKYLDVEEQL